MKNLDATNVTVVGKSTDPKPTMASGYSEGDVFFERDTGKAYMMDESGEWVEL